MAESVQIQSVSHRHAAIADTMLANPMWRQGQVAKHHGVSQSWLSIVVNSDVFKEYFAERRKQHDQALREQITQATLEVTLKSLDKLGDALDASDVKPEFVLNANEALMKTLGYGARPSVRVTESRTLETSQPVDADALASARARMTRRVTQTIEHESTP